MTWGADRVRRWVKGLCVGIATGVGSVGLAFSPLGTDFETAVGLAWLYNARGTIEAPPDVVVVAINKRTARRMGLPDEPVEWPRSIHARLIDGLVERGASVIVFDLHFGRQKSPEDEILLADAITRAGRVVAADPRLGLLKLEGGRHRHDRRSSSRCRRRLASTSTRFAIRSSR